MKTLLFAFKSRFLASGVPADAMLNPLVIFTSCPESRRNVAAFTLPSARATFRLMSPLAPVASCNVPPATDTCCSSAGVKLSPPAPPILIDCVLAFGCNMTAFAPLPALTVPVSDIASAVSVTDAPAGTALLLVVSIAPPTVNVPPTPAPVVPILIADPLLVIAPNPRGALEVTNNFPVPAAVVVTCN